MKLRLEIEVLIDDEIMGTDNLEEKEWFREMILIPETLILHSNEIGDEVGSVKIVKFL